MYPTGRAARQQPSGTLGGLKAGPEGPVYHCRDMVSVPRSLLRASFIAALLFAQLSALAAPRTFTIQSEPSGAIVYLNGAEIGMTPYVYSYDKAGDLPLMIELRMSGWQHRTVDLLRILKNSRIHAKAITVDLFRDVPVDVQRSELPVVTAEHQLKGKDLVLGKFGSQKLTPVSRELYDLAYPEELTNRFIAGMRSTCVDPKYVKRATQKGDEAIRRAKVYVLPVVKKLALDLAEYDDHAFGTVELTVDWRFFSGLRPDSLLFSYERATTYHAFQDAPSEVLALAARAAGRRLTEEEGLADRLAALYTVALALGKGDPILIPKPRTVQFAGRKDMMTALVKAVVTVQTADGHGSGFIIGNDGYIITNAHVVGTEGKVKVRFEQGFTLDGTVQKVNTDHDLALIKTPGSDLAALAIGNDAELLLGEELFAIGTPLDQQLGQSVTRGIMSGRREFRGKSFLQTDVSINAGNSGGPLLDENGKVVGVTTRKVSEGGVEGIGFAVPISTALDMLNITFAP